VFGIFKRDGLAYTEIVPSCSKRTLLAMIWGKVKPEVVIHSDGRRNYDGLADVGYAKHQRIQHGKKRFARGKCHTNGIESFWGYAKRRLAKFDGAPDHKFYLHLTECEFRFNRRRRGNLYKVLLAVLKKDPP
jgi:transposase